MSFAGLVLIDGMTYQSQIRFDRTNEMILYLVCIIPAGTEHTIILKSNVTGSKYEFIKVVLSIE